MYFMVWWVLLEYSSFGHIPFKKLSVTVFVVNVVSLYVYLRFPFAINYKEVLCVLFCTYRSASRMVTDEKAGL